MAYPSPPKTMHTVKKRPWSQVEDDALIQLVSMYGPEQWMKISKDHGSRNAKQCRERYHQNLKPTINRGRITAEEGVIIERLRVEKGPKWVEISRALGGRSDNQIKNWYNGQKNRRIRVHAHNGQQVILDGVQHSSSAVKPVDVAMLQRRGHKGPYPRGNGAHYNLPRPSPTISQISEAPSLVSDASSTGPGISPSSITAYLACANAWPLAEDSLRSNLPPLHQLPSLLPYNIVIENPFRSPTYRQGANPASLQRRKAQATDYPGLQILRQDHVAHRRETHVVDNWPFPRPSYTLGLVSGQLPPVRSLLSSQNGSSFSGAQTQDVPPTPPLGVNPTPRTLPRTHTDGYGALGGILSPLCSHLRSSSSYSPRPNSRRAPYPSYIRPAHASAAAASHGPLEGRMSLANLLG